MIEFKLIKSAIFSNDKKHRYVLVRDWSNQDVKKSVMFIGLNPSTADENVDDPTIRRCINYAKSWGFNTLLMTNLFAYRATNPRDMLSTDDPVGNLNDRYLIEYANKAELVVACWGNLGTHINRAEQVRDMIKKLTCLKLTKNAQPAHPLYLPKVLIPKPI